MMFSNEMTQRKWNKIHMYHTLLINKNCELQWIVIGKKNEKKIQKIKLQMKSISRTKFYIIIKKNENLN